MTTGGRPADMDEIRDAKIREASELIANLQRDRDRLATRLEKTKERCEELSTRLDTVLETFRIQTIAWGAREVRMAKAILAIRQLADFRDRALDQWEIRNKLEGDQKDAHI